MSEFVDFKISGKIDGREITPTTLNISRFNEFNNQVEDFVIGPVEGGTGQKLLLDTVFVEIVPGSYLFRAMLPLALMVTIEPILHLLNTPGGMSKLDEKRAKIVEKWQWKAKSHSVSYELKMLRSDGRQIPAVQIGPDTNYVREETGQWIPSEAYLLGEIFDMGGEKPNVHIRLVETGMPYIVQTDKETLRKLPKNIIYERALLRVFGEQNVESGNFRNLRLLQFVDYHPAYQEGELSEFIEKGQKAWKGVKNPSEWVGKLRGGS